MRLVQSDNSSPLMKIRNSNRSAQAPAGSFPSQQAFERCFEEHWASIYRLLRRMLGDPAEAEDLALEAFYRLYQRQPGAEPDFNAGGWLYRVAINLGLHSIRAFRRRERHELSAGRTVFEEAPEDRPAEIQTREEERELARRALAEMNTRQSRLLVMRYSGMAYKDIALALHLSPTSIGPLLVRAEREFEKRYRALMQEEP